MTPTQDVVEERPRQSAELVTKGIRSKSNPIETQVQNARDLFIGSTNVFLPNKQEFILDWLLGNLKATKKKYQSAHVEAELWRLLSDMWNDESLDSMSRTSCSRKHNFVGILQDAMDNLCGRPTEERIEIMTAMDQALERILDRYSVVKIRPQMEQATVLFGECLFLVNELPTIHGDLGSKFVSKFSQIFRTILHDDRQTKKVAKAFSKNCLRSSLVYLVNNISQLPTTEKVEKCIQDALFSPENLVDYINAINVPESSKTEDNGFNGILKSISSNSGPRDSFDEILGLPILLSIGLAALLQASSKFTPDQTSLLGATFLGAMDAFSIASSLNSGLSVVYLSNRHLQKLCSLLQVFLKNPAPPSDALSSTLTSIATTCFSFLEFTDGSVTELAWNALALVMNIDFDVVLSMMNQLNPKLEHATLDFLNILVTTNFKLRSGVEFIKHWTILLDNAGAESNILEHPDLITLISEEVHRNLSSSQILELLQFLNADLAERKTTMPLKAVMLGIKSPQIIEEVSPYISKTLGPALCQILRHKNALEGLFEIYFLMLELSDTLALELYDSKAVNRMRKLCQKSAALYPLQCILRLTEVGGLTRRANKKLSKAFQKSLEASPSRLNVESHISLEDAEISLPIISALIQRWILLMNDIASEQFRKDFLRIVLDLGSQYDSFRSHEGNTGMATECAKLQYRLLMSSDVYEREGLVGPLMEILGLDLEVPASSLVNGNVETNGDKLPVKQEWRLKRMRNAVTIVSRIPLEPISLQRKNLLFDKLLALDQAIVSRKLHERPKKTVDKADLLVVLRCALNRFVSVVARNVVEDITLIDKLFGVFKSLDKFPSPELRLATVNFGETLLGRLANSSSTQVEGVLLYLIDTISTKSSYKLKTLRASLRTWLATPNGHYFTPDGETVLAITILTQLTEAKQKFDAQMIEKFEMMRINTLTQLRDCLMELLDADTFERGLSRATYLSETMRKLLVNGSSRMDLEGLMARFGHAFSDGMKQLNQQRGEERDLIVHSLHEMFKIMCFQNAFDSPIVLCAAYISLCRIGQAPRTEKGIDVCFGKLISNLDADELDLVFQELLSTAIEDAVAINALHVVMDAANEGPNLPFTIAKLLFELTRSLLVTSSSDIFVGLAKLVVKILREKSKAVSKWNLDHLIANLTIACSPTCRPLKGSALQDEIFEAIGSIALAILQLYPKRLTQKYHLVVRMLQIMLHVFVRTTPLAPRNLRDTLSRPPPWLTTSCSAPSAQLFARILAMWANPPSITWHNTTKEAKRQLISTAAKTSKAVSKHIPWFMMEYVSLQSEYPELFMEEPVQKALAPGLYALFSVLGTYEREMCMSALDGPGRGIFKTLWEDWNKFGRFVQH